MAMFLVAMLGRGQLGGQQILAQATVQKMQRPSHTARPGYETIAYGLFTNRARAM
jgi:CubicO group peptidase (beta-lactamase class C family)